MTTKFLPLIGKNQVYIVNYSIVGVENYQGKSWNRFDFDWSIYLDERLEFYTHYHGKSESVHQIRQYLHHLASSIGRYLSITIPVEYVIQQCGPVGISRLLYPECKTFIGYYDILTGSSGNLKYYKYPLYLTGNISIEKDPNGHADLVIITPDIVMPGEYTTKDAEFYCDNTKFVSLIYECILKSKSQILGNIPEKVRTFLLENGDFEE